MSVTIHLEAVAEAKLREQAARLGSNLEDYLSKLAESWANTQATAMPMYRSPEAWEAEWRASATSHPTLPDVVDDSRESIYEGRGE